MADDAGELNRLLAETSFLFGGNAAFIEDLYARWAADPTSVEPSWRAFFSRLHDGVDQVRRETQAPTWAAPPIVEPRPEWLSAVDGLWPAVEAKFASRVAEADPAA